MSDDSTTTIRATFKTREAADLAIEHLVQQHGISRPDIFVQPVASENSAGSAPSGGDVASNGDTRTDPPLESEIEVSADIAAGKSQQCNGVLVLLTQSGFPDVDHDRAGRTAPYCVVELRDIADRR